MKEKMYKVGQWFKNEMFPDNYYRIAVVHLFGGSTQFELINNQPDKATVCTSGKRYESLKEINHDLRHEPWSQALMPIPPPLITDND